MCDKATLAVWFSGMFFFDGILALFVIFGWARISLGTWLTSMTDGAIIFVIDMIIAFLLFKYGTKTVKSFKRVKR